MDISLYGNVSPTYGYMDYDDLQGGGDWADHGAGVLGEEHHWGGAVPGFSTSYSKNLAVSPVIFWEHKLNTFTPRVLGFDLWLWLSAQYVLKLFFDFSSAQYILTVCPGMLQLQPAHCQCRLKRKEGDFQSSQWDTHVCLLVQLGEEKQTTHFQSFQ